MRSLDNANKTWPVVASAAQRVVSWEYLLMPSVSFVVEGLGTASGGRRLEEASLGWKGLEEASRSESSLRLSYRSRSKGVE